jgi:hypothetical protein
MPSPTSDDGHVVGVVAAEVRLEHRTVKGFLAWLLVRIAAVTSAAGVAVALVHGGFSLLTWWFLAVFLLAAALVVKLRTRRSAEGTCEVRRFRLTTTDGGHVECVAVGALTGVHLRAGDHVTVRGKRDREGILVVRRILVTVTAAGATPRPGMGFRAARVANAIAAVLVVAVAFLLGFLILSVA